MIYPLRHSKSFYPSLLLFLFDWWMKGKKTLRGVNELYGLYLLCHTNGQFQVYLIASSIKILAMFLLCTNSSQPEWFHVKTYMDILGLWFANTGALKIVIKLTHMMIDS